MAANPSAENTEQTTAPAAHANGAQLSETSGTAADAATAAPTIPEPRLPTRKDTSLKEFLNKMDDYAPIVRNVCIIVLVQ